MFAHVLQALTGSSCHRRSLHTRRPRTVIIYGLLNIGLLFAVARVRLRRTLT